MYCVDANVWSQKENRLNVLGNRVIYKREKLIVYVMPTEPSYIQKNAFLLNYIIEPKDYSCNKSPDILFWNRKNRHSQLTFMTQPLLWQFRKEFFLIFFFFHDIYCNFRKQNNAWKHRVNIHTWVTASLGVTNCNKITDDPLLKANAQCKVLEDEH